MDAFLSCVSELQCEVGGIAVLPLEEELLSIPLPELLTSDSALLCYLSHILQAYKGFYSDN